MRFISWEEMCNFFSGKRVALVGSGPSSTLNPVGLVDSYDLVVRIQNYKLVNDALSGGTGLRTDVHYSFYGKSMRIGQKSLKEHGVRLCISSRPCKNGLIKSSWHVSHGLANMINFEWIYEYRRHFWFCDTYVPDSSEFLTQFNLLGRHIPSTGFSAIWTLMQLPIRELFLTGFDFFSSRLHNVNEKWVGNDPKDPIGHDYARELSWLRDTMLVKRFVRPDAVLLQLLVDSHDRRVV